MSRISLVLLMGLLAGSAARPCLAQNLADPPWRQDPTFRRIASVLDTVWAIDGHTHLFRFAPYRADGPPSSPLGGRSINDPAIRRALVSRFGVDPEDDIGDMARQVQEKRSEELRSLGPTRYWHRHLDRTRTQVALVNENTVSAVDHERLRWVPSATTLLFPLPGEGFVRSRGDAANLTRTQAELNAFLSEVGFSAVPARLDQYLDAVDRVLRHWRDEGAVAVKFFDAYMRTLQFADVPFSTAAALFEEGGTRELSRAEYITVQDHIARHIFAVAGEEGLAVHIHSSSGRPPFMRLGDADVRNLESVLTDPALFGTRFVLIHGGFPLTLEAAYLALKPHVWVDVSAMGWYPPPDLAAMLRTFILAAPKRILFGTDATTFPGVPGGAEVAHIARSEVTREALYMTLAGLVRDGVLDVDGALSIGRDILADNARRLYGW